jgi:hypothetical protein
MCSEGGRKQPGPEAYKGKEGMLSSEPPEGISSANTLTRSQNSGLQNANRIHSCVLLHEVYGNLLQQKQETITVEIGLGRGSGLGCWNS